MINYKLKQSVIAELRKHNYIKSAIADELKCSTGYFEKLLRDNDPRLTQIAFLIYLSQELKVPQKDLFEPVLSPVKK